MKILVTLGPSSMNEPVVRAMSELGVHLFRINLSHTKFEGLEELIERIRGWTDVPISLDSEGAQLRNGAMESETVQFTAGEKVTIHTSPVTGDSTVPMRPPEAVREAGFPGEPTRPNKTA